MSAIPASSITSSESGRGRVVAGAPLVEQRVQGACRDAGAAGQLDRRPGRRGRADHRVPGLLEGGADRVEGEGLAGAGRADQHRHRLTVGGDGADGGELVVAQRRPTATAALDRSRRQRLANRRRRVTAARKRASTSTSSRLVHRAGSPVAVATATTWSEARTRPAIRSIVSTVAPWPCRAATARIRSASVNVDAAAVSSVRSRSAIHSSGSTMRSWCSGRPCSSNTTRVEPPAPVERACRLAAGTSRRAVRRRPVPTRPPRLRPSSRRRSGRARPRACGAGWPAPPPGDPPACPECRSRPATPRPRATASRTRRAAPGGCRRSRGRDGRAATPPPATRSSSSRNTAWNTSPAARACRYRSAPYRALHRPSLPSAMLATSTCQCSSGSPAREVRCRNDAATTPDVASWRGPTPGSSAWAASHAWLCEPRRTRIASRSNQPSAARIAASPASITAPCTRGSSDTAYSTDADFGALNVRSNPGTRRGCGRGLLPVRRQPTPPGRQPGQHRPQIIGVDLAVEAEPPGAAADPHAARLAGAGVVVVEGLGDPRQLVGLLTDAELGDRQHRQPTDSPYTLRVKICERNRPSAGADGSERLAAGESGSDASEAPAGSAGAS